MTSVAYFSCELSFLKLLNGTIIHSIFSNFIELPLLLLSYSVKNIVACFLKFLRSVLISRFYLDLLFPSSVIFVLLSMGHCPEMERSALRIQKG